MVKTRKVHKRDSSSRAAAAAVREEGSSSSSLSAPGPKQPPAKRRRTTPASNGARLLALNKLSFRARTGMTRRMAATLTNSMPAMQGVGDARGFLTVSFKSPYTVQGLEKTRRILAAIDPTGPRERAYCELSHGWRAWL